MKRYSGFWDKIVSMENLYEAHKNARKDKEFYHEVQMVDKNPEKYLKKIQDMLVYDTYSIKPSDYHISMLHDRCKERELRKLDYYPHRIIQWAIMLQIQPYFLKRFCYHTCASIPGRGGNHARKLMEQYLQKDVVYCLKVDIKKFYPNIDHNILKQQLRQLFKDKKLLHLLDKIIESNPGGIGLPIGSYVSQFLANFYLTGLDEYLKSELKERYVVRYMDDIVILHNSKNHLKSVLEKMEQYVTERLSLQLKENKQIFPIAARGVDFIGYRFFPDYKLLRKSTCKAFKKCCLQAQLKIDKKQLLSKHEFCSINSYIGWLKWCNSYRLKQKYVAPLIGKLVEYYRYVIHSSLPKIKRDRLARIYENRVLKMLKGGEW